MPGRGLIVGKFYPPHRGHKHLIDFGRSRVGELSVIVCQKPGEFPGGELRAAWLREIHPDANVLLIDDVYDEQDSRVWAENSIRWLGFVPDVVFTSEDYGERFAHFLGCEHILVDKNRETVPISGTMVRSNPLSCWDFLEPPVRAWYAKRICLVGAESTGKTTLAQMLAERYQTIWVPEYGREYSERKLAEDDEYNWRSEEFTLIAKTQCERENEAARRANKALICDTDAFATSVWHRRYLGERSPEVEAIAAGHRRPDLYLLTNIDTPFVQDGMRDGEMIREWMHETFVAEMTAQGRPFHLLSGSLQERLRQAIERIDELIAGKR
jgi:NadR type nicotinamide-nucleotide adenylyltransferase